MGVDDGGLQAARGFVVCPDVLEACLVEGQVSAPEAVEVRWEVGGRGADGEDERGGEGGGGGVEAWVVGYARCGGGGGRGGVGSGGVDGGRVEEEEAGVVVGEFLGLEVVDVEDGRSGSGSKAAECFRGHCIGGLRS